MDSPSRDLSSYDRLLREIDRQMSLSVTAGTGPARRRRTPRYFAGVVVRFVAALVLPFVILIRGSVVANERLVENPWFALAISGSVTTLLVSVYLFWAGRRLSRTAKLGRISWRMALVVVTGYLLYVTVYVSGVNLKNDGLRAYYSQLSPILRGGLGTIILVDRDMIITDLRRDSSAYQRMGLPTRRESLHYVQPRTGYVHAVDLRTIGRPEWKNKVVGLYFRVMGFRILRHVGTADHLHVSLKLPR